MISIALRASKPPIDCFPLLGDELLELAPYGDMKMPTLIRNYKEFIKLYLPLSLSALLLLIFL